MMIVSVGIFPDTGLMCLRAVRQVVFTANGSLDGRDRTCILDRNPECNRDDGNHRERDQSSTVHVTDLPFYLMNQSSWRYGFAGSLSASFRCSRNYSLTLVRLFAGHQQRLRSISGLESERFAGYCLRPRIRKGPD